jgi:hypothetical protein
MQELRDASLKVTRALPNGAATVTSVSIDTGLNAGAIGAGVLGNQAIEGEYELTAPALATGQLGDAATMKYNIVTADSADLQTNPVTYITAAITQTGAGGAGAAGQVFRFRLPTTAKRYVGFTATNSAAGNASAASAFLELLL